MLDVFQGVAAGITGLIAQHKINEWAKLIFTLALSGFNTFLLTSGASLVAHRPAWEACGSGMILSAVVTTALFRRSPLTKGMLIMLPADEAKLEMDNDLQDRKSTRLNSSH